MNIDNLDFTGVESALRLTLAPGQTLDLRYSWLHGVQDTAANVYTKYTFNYPVDSAVVAWQAESAEAIPGAVPPGRFEPARPRPLRALGCLRRLQRGPGTSLLQISNLTNTSYQEILGVSMPGRTVVGGVEWVVR